MAPRGWDDPLGPVQVLLIGIDERGSERMLAAELQDLDRQDAIRALDVLRVRRGLDGGVERLDPLDPRSFPGTLVEALMVADPEQENGGGARAALAARAREGTWVLAERIPRGAGAAVLLIEHRWAIPLREAAAAFEAEIFGDAWVHPRDLDAARRVARHGLTG